MLIRVHFGNLKFNRNEMNGKISFIQFNQDFILKNIRDEPIKTIIPIILQDDQSVIQEHSMNLDILSSYFNFVFKIFNPKFKKYFEKKLIKDFSIFQEKNIHKTFFKITRLSLRKCNLIVKVEDFKTEQGN